MLKKLFPSSFNGLIHIDVCYEDLFALLNVTQSNEMGILIPLVHDIGIGVAAMVHTSDDWAKRYKKNRVKTKKTQNSSSGKVPFPSIKGTFSTKASNHSLSEVPE